MRCEPVAERRFGRWTFSGRGSSVALRRIAFGPVLLGLTALAASPVAAQVVTPFTPRFEANAPGAIDLVGNTVMTCPSSAPACGSARAGTAAGNGNNNNNYNMVQVDVDQDPTTFNSSRAVLALPSGAEVLWAGLYWGGDTSAGTGGVPAPNPANRTQVRFAAPAPVDYVTLTGSLLGSITTNLGTDYGVFADVTSLVAAAGNGAYTAANVQTGTGMDRGGGWSLVVAYRAPGLPARNLVVFDGFANVAPNSTVTIDVDGFVTPPAGVTTTQLGSVVWEGDRGFSGDSFRLDSTTLANALNPADNFFNGSLTADGVRLTAKTPNYVNQLSFDVDRVSANGVLPNGSTSATLTLSTTMDAFYPGAVTFATDIYSPTITATKTSVDLDGGETTRPGDLVEYTVTATNVGLDAAVGVVLFDAVPVGSSFEPGSLEILSGPGAGAQSDAAGDDRAEFDASNDRVVFRLGTGATAAAGGTLAPGASTSVRFAVRVDADAVDGAELDNQASIDYRAAILGTELTSSSSLVVDPVRLPVLELTKIDSPDPVAAGGLVTYELAFANRGSVAATDVVLSDSVPADTAFVSATGGGSLGGGFVTWNLGTLAPGASGSVSMTVRVASPLADGTLISNLATLAASNAASAQASASTTVTSTPVLVLAKDVAPEPVEAGGILTYTLTFANVGSDAASGVVLEDAVPPNTTFVAATSGGSLVGGVVTWNLGLLPAGAGGSVSLKVAVDEPLANGTMIPNQAAIRAANALAAQASSTTTAASAPRLVIEKSATPDPVEAGGELIYTLRFANQGTDAAVDVFVVDALPSRTRFVSATGDAFYDEALHQVVWNLGTLQAGAAGSVTITVEVESPLADGTVLVNVARASATGVSAVEAVARTTVASAPALSLAKSASPEPVAAGDPVTFTLAFANGGNADATGVVLEDVLPDELTFVSATGGGAYDAGTRTITWSLGTLSAGTYGAVTFQATVVSPLARGTRITNAASLACDQVPPVAAVAVSTVVSAPVLRLEKRAAPDSVAAGGGVTYTLAYANLGNEDASNVVLEDLLPVRASFVSATGGGVLSAGIVTWSLGTLASGASGSVSVAVQVDSPLASGTRLVNVATLSSAETQPVSAQVSSTVTSSPVLSLDKIAASDPVAAGDELVYRLGYANVGTDVATGVVLVDVLPAATTFVSASAGGVFDAASGVVTWTLGSVSPGASGIETLTVRVNSPLPAGTRLRNVATLSSVEMPPVSATALTAVTSVGALTLTKTAAPSPVDAGQPLVYTLSYANPGSDAVTNAVLVDTLPTRALFVSASAGGVFDPVGRTVTWSLGDLAAGTSGSVTVTVRAATPSPSGTLLSNTAVLRGDGVSSASASALTAVRAPRLSLVKTALSSTVQVGETVFFELAYANVGDGAAVGVVLTDRLPLGTEPVSIDVGGVYDSAAGTVTWSLGTLGPGATGSLLLELRILEPVGSAVNEARLEAADTTPVTARAEIVVESRVAVEIPTLSDLGTALLVVLLLLAGVTTRRRIPGA